MSAPRAVGIVGLGSYLPPMVRGNDYWDGKLRSRDKAQRSSDFIVVESTVTGERAEVPEEIRAAMEGLGDDIFRGARLRHVLGDDDEVSDMEAEAARRALADAGVAPDEIDLVLVHSPVPDAITPYNPPAVQAKCGLSRASAWSLDVGCASFQPQLLTAASLVRAGACRRVLCVFSFAGTRVVDERKHDSVGMGDGASAMVVAEVPEGYGLLGQYMRTDGSLRAGVVIAPVEDGRAQRRWWAACRGPFQLSSFDVATGKLLGLRSTTFCREACEGALRDAGVDLSDIALFVCNQSLGWFVDACRRGLGLPAERAVDTFGEVANLAAAAIPLNLERARAQGRLRDGDLVLVYSPGAGFTRAAVVIRWHQPGPAAG